MALDWTGQGKPGPDYMRTGEFIPCDYKKRFFIKGHTSGVAHAGKKRVAAVMVVHKCGTRVKTKKCSTERV